MSVCVLFQKRKSPFPPRIFLLSSLKFPAEWYKGHGVSLTGEGMQRSGEGASVGGRGARCVEPLIAI